ncbi:MAG: CotH kinase family protein [Bacteroidota bacterium]
MTIFPRPLLGMPLCVIVLLACQKKEIPPLLTLSIQTENELDTLEKKAIAVSYEAPIDGYKKYAARAKLLSHSNQSKKSSFDIELEKKAVLGEVAEEDDWVLLAVDDIAAYVQHEWCKTLLHRINTANLIPRGAFVQVNFNANDLGLYYLQEEINGGKLDVKKRDPLSIILKNPPFFQQYRTDEASQTDNYYQQIFPKKSPQNLAQYMSRLEDFLWTSSDETFEKEVTQWFDLDNVMDWHLLQLLLTNGKKTPQSSFLYKTSTEAPFRIALTDYPLPLFLPKKITKENITFDLPNHILLKRLLQTNARRYRQGLKNRWKLIIEEQLFTEEWINQFFEKQLSPSLWEAVKKDKSHQNHSKEWTLVEKELLDIKNFLKLKRSMMDTFLEKY